MVHKVNKFLLYIILFFSSFTTFSQVVELEDPPAVAQKNLDVQKWSDTTAIQPLPFQSNFKENYSGTDFQYETVAPDTSAWNNFKAWLQYWLGRIFSFGLDGANPTALEIVLKVIAILIVLFVVYMIVKTILNKEGNWIFGKSSQKKIATSDAIDEDIHSINFEKAIRDSKNSNDYRLAIRYYYLWLLKRLSDKSLIEWDIEKTNSDYLYEISNPKLRQDFAYLSYIYDYSWYGEFELNETAFIQSEKTFLNTFNSL